jgi:uncharacterized protein YigE (DUF2233 family)
MRSRRHPITILGTLLVAFLWASGSASLAIDGTPRNECRTVFVAGSSFAVCTIDLRRHKVRLFWKGPDGQAYGSFDRLRQGMRGSELVVAMNGGMFDHDLAPVGLFIENGQQLKRANTADGPGNFHLKPNGVFFVSGTRAGVLETGRYLRQRPATDFATQSGPMLVIDGRIHPRISAHGTSRKIRNGVGMRDQHTVVFAISNEPVTFHAFARLFRDELGCDNALFLDGSVSSLYAPQLGRKDDLRPMGPIIGVLRRQ